ncbi:class I SAM-dependent DNA methyltransferase [Methylobacterium persicinum]|uniref:SAM-dependent methyltransferase n=1 Tax=Methylobacterium persicinum TaxID=374426 RepID=A0ABU0HNW1_9HYPH|nr:class I SAM-dependent methyltransferase [Methylobacterium persicinum]MDQ0443637.1 SAM-dependent methyltransferase [Methylobacterium persicinum]GJE36787.1 Ubiquinone biosynthesis O-methyltransferase, mitochondrial [Methylobacterium persicinum]
MTDRHAHSLPASYFDERYAADPDPWQFETSAYERAKYQASLEALPRARYASALEVGCSIGVLTEALAQRCDAVFSVDLAERALDRARKRCRSLPHVRFALARVPDQWPEGTFDLILLSEVVYYLDAADVGRLVARVRGSLRPGGAVLLVHWTGETHYPLTGDEAAECFIGGADAFLRVHGHTRTDKYRLDVLAGF